VHPAKIPLCAYLMILSFSLTALTFPLLEATNLEPLPIRVGEILTYSVKIVGLPAGKQITKVAQETMLNGYHVYHLTSESQTDGVFAKLYHFRDWKESYVTTDHLYPVRHVKTLEDRKYRAQVKVDFDLDQGIAQYSKNRNSKSIEIPIGIQDELSMVYFVRLKQLKVGQTYMFAVLVKDKPQDVTLTIDRREVMKTEALGRVETLVLRTSHGYLMWLTNDKRRIPVRIEADTPFGRLTGTLEKVDFVN